MKIRPLILAALCCLAAGLSLFGCGASNTYSPALGGGTPIVPTPSFTLAVAPTTRTIAPGQATTYTVTVTPANNFNSAVSLTITGLPAGASAAFAPTAVTPTGNAAASSTLTVTTISAVASGSTVLTITGTGGGITRTGTATLVVQRAAPQNGNLEGEIE